MTQAPASPAEFEQALRLLGTSDRAGSEKAYLKVDLEFAGVSVPAARAAVVSWCRDCQADSGGKRGAGHHGRGPARDQVITMASGLWESSLFESRLAAVLLLERTARLLELADLGPLESMLRTSGTWALADSLASNVAGDIAERYASGSAPVLDRWAADQDFWIRRSAMLALLRPLRRGGGDFARFAGYADAMLGEKEFFIRKAIGWVLRETAKRQPDLVAGWLAPRVHRASGVTVREAVKPLPAAARDLLLTGYREKRPVHLPMHKETQS